MHLKQLCLHAGMDGSWMVSEGLSPEGACWCLRVWNFYTSMFGYVILFRYVPIFRYISIFRLYVDI